MRLRGAPTTVIALIALFAAIGGGFAIAGNKIKTKQLANQAVTNKKIKKKTIKGNRVAANALTGAQIDETTLSGAGTGRSVSQSTASSIPAVSGFTVVLSIQVPPGSYLFFSKAVLAKGGVIGPVQCRLIADGSADRSLAYVDATSNETVPNMLPHTFAAAGTVSLECDNPNATAVFVTDKRISAIPLAALENSSLP